MLIQFGAAALGGILVFEQEEEMMAEMEASVESIPQAYLGQPTDQKRAAETGPLPEIAVYQNRNFDGALELFRTNLSISGLGDYNDKISSFVIVSGVWEFFKDKDYVGRVGSGSQQFGPGYYPWVEDVGIPNDSISSFRWVSY